MRCLCPSPRRYAKMLSPTRILLQAASARPVYRRAAAAAAASSTAAPPTSARTATSSPAAASASRSTPAPAPRAGLSAPLTGAFDPYGAEEELSRVAPLAPPLPSRSSAASSSSAPAPTPPRAAAAGLGVDCSPLAEFGKPPFPPSYADQLAQSNTTDDGASSGGIDWTTAWNGLGTAVISREQAQMLMRPLMAEEIQIKPGAPSFVPSCCDKITSTDRRCAAVPQMVCSTSQRSCTAASSTRPWDRDSGDSCPADPKRSRRGS
jgi:hypothetical protein